MLLTTPHHAQRDTGILPTIFRLGPTGRFVTLARLILKLKVGRFPDIEFSSATDITRDDCPASNLISEAIRKPLTSINIAVFTPH
jgi:hypothetical protein